MTNSLIYFNLEEDLNKLFIRQDIQMAQNHVKSCFIITGHQKIAHIKLHWANQVALVVKNLPANAGDVRDAGSNCGSGRSPGGGHGNPL